MWRSKQSICKSKSKKNCQEKKSKILKSIVSSSFDIHHKLNNFNVCFFLFEWIYQQKKMNEWINEYCCITRCEFFKIIKRCCCLLNTLKESFTSICSYTIIKNKINFNFNYFLEALEEENYLFIAPENLNPPNLSSSSSSCESKWWPSTIQSINVYG